MPTCMFVCLFICLFAFLYIYMFVNQAIALPKFNIAPGKLPSQ